MAAPRLRKGKAYEHTVFGLLLEEEFDLYVPLVDDQSIDAVIRIQTDGGRRFFELQIKGSQTWNGIRCHIGKLKPDSVLLLYCAEKRELLWFCSDDVERYFQATNPVWGDVFLDKKQVEHFKLEGHHRLADLKLKLNLIASGLRRGNEVNQETVS